MKVRGKADLLKNATIRKGMSGVTRLVKSYRYENDEGQLYLLINFDRERVEQLIRKAGFPIWDKTRADSLVWMAIQTTDRQSRTITTADSHPPLFRQLELRAKTRGIQLVYPLWDLDDVQNLTVYDIWGGFSQQIMRASERYGVQSVLSARVYQGSQDPEQTVGVNGNLSSKEWVADWTLIQNGKLQAGQVKADTIVLLGSQLVDVLADQLAEIYAVDLNDLYSSTQNVEITIRNIDTLQAYVDVSNFLQNLSVVNTASLIKQQGSSATFEVDLLGEYDDLKNAFELGGKITPVLDQFGQARSDSEFSWGK
ncbi:DUF2066 domain-containing protein [Paraglaciecola aquimarina]|uniref:DUF2066 domain-containing protein n=1 Tax=Paraglaciecola aquimarina TaxID=1235557 RepID=UPI003D177F0B